MKYFCSRVNAILKTENKIKFIFIFIDTSEFIKIDFLNQQSAQTQLNTVNDSTISKPSTPGLKTVSNYSFRWNSEPNHVVCVFPYLIGFADQFIEIRLLVNGNLVNSLCLSNVKLIANKKEIFFTADHESFILNELSDRFFNSFQININANPNSYTDEFSPPISPMHGSNQLPPQLVTETSNNANQTHSTTNTGSANLKFNLNNNNSDTNIRQLKEPCTIYNINLNFLNSSASSRSNKKFFINQLVENSTRTIKRDTSNYSSQFVFNDSDDMPQKNSIYQKIITSNVGSNFFLFS